MMKTLLYAIACFSTALGMAQATNYPNGSLVDDFTVTDIEGNTFSLYEITAQGKYVILDFFFAGCPPCQASQPHFNQLHQTYGCNGHDLFIASINNGDDNDAQVLAYENTYGGTYAHSPAVSNQGGGPAVTSAFGVGAFPTYVLIGPDNVMKVNDIWPISNMASFVAAFPAGSDIQPAQCAAVGVSEQSVDLVSAVYPSPTTGQITLETSISATGRIGIEVIDLLGRTVQQHDLGVRTTGRLTERMDLSALTTGTYSIRILWNGSAIGMQDVVILR